MAEVEAKPPKVSKCPEEVEDSIELTSKNGTTANWPELEDSQIRDMFTRRSCETAYQIKTNRS